MIEKEVIIQGNKLRYGEMRGDGGVVHIFLHGWGSDHTVFSSLVRSVSVALALDFPGFGGSTMPKQPWTLAEYAALLRAFVDKKAEGREIVFIAHSFGGRVLLKMLNQQSAMSWVRRVICIGVPFDRALTLPQKCAAVVGGAGKAALAFLPKSIARKARERWCALLGAEDYAALGDEVMKKTFQNIVNEDVRILAQSLKEYPTDFIWGSDDAAAPLEDAEAVADEVDATLYVVEGGDHFPFVGSTEEAFMSFFKKSSVV